MEISGSPQRDIEPDIRVGFILSPRFTLLPFAGFVDTLRHAADEGDNSQQIYCHWRILGVSLEPVRSSCGAEILPWQTLSDPRDFDYIVVVGGLLPASENHPPAVYEFLRSAQAADVCVVGLCTGCFTMARAGLLDGKRCVVHFRHFDEFRVRYPNVNASTHEVYVIDENVVTCPGGTAAIDVAVELIGQHSGRARALKGLADMIVDEHRVAFHIPRHPHDELDSCGDRRVEQAVKLMRRQLSEPGSVREIARKLSISVSQLNRAFRARTDLSPAALWREIRLQHGRWRILNSNRSVTEIAHECGFSDCAHFIRHFKGAYGETPQAARARRSSAPSSR